MENQKKASIKEDLKTLIKAIYALMPSRNIVSQLIMLLPLREENIEELFPEAIEDIEYWDIFRTGLGLSKSYRGDIEVYSYSTLAGILKDFINRVFEVLRDERSRAAISSLLGEIVPNMEREWLDVRVKAVLRNPAISNVAKKILMLLVETQNVNIKELSRKLNISENDVKQCIYVLRNLKLIDISGDNVSLSLPYGIRERYISYIKKLLIEAK